MMATEEEVEEATPAAPAADSTPPGGPDEPATEGDGAGEPGAAAATSEEEKTGVTDDGEAKSGEADDDLTEAAFDKWISDAKESKLNATVSDPTVVQSGMMGQVKYGYKVCCPALGSTDGVWRRYSDFEWLYNVLAARYSGMVIPPMPEKRLANTGTKFLEQRNRQLGAWLMLALAIPYVRRDATVHEFLTSAQQGKEWDELKRTALEEARAPWLKREGCRHWRYYLTTCLSLPSDNAEILNATWATCDTQIKLVNACLTSLNQCELKQNSLYAAISAAGEKFEILGFASSPGAVINGDMPGGNGGGAERKSSVASAVEADLPASSSSSEERSSIVDAVFEVEGAELKSLKSACNELARAFTALSAGLVGSQEAIAARAAFWRLCVTGLMKHWKAHAEEVLAVNKKLTGIIAALGKAEMAVKTKSAKLVQLKEKHGLQEDIVTKTEAALEYEKMLVRSYTTEEECVRKALANDEAVKFVNSRTRSLKRLIAQLCVLSSATHSYSATSWAGVSAAAKQALASLEAQSAEAASEFA
jgi:hypothetical protein